MITHRAQIMKKGMSAFLALASVLALMSGPAFALGFTGRGIRRYKRQDYEEAIALLNGACADNPKDSRATYYLGLAYLRTWDLPRAERSFRAALALDPSSGKAAYYLADTLCLEGKYEDSLKASAAIKPGSPFEGKAHYVRGRALLKLGRSREAIDEFGRAGKLDASLATKVNFETARAYFKEGRYGKAGKLFKGIITRNPYSDWALYSKDYLQALEKMPPRYRVEAGAGLQYDDNVLAVPLNSAFSDIGRQKDGKEIFYLLGEYNFLNRGPWDLKGSYYFNIGQYFRSGYTGYNGKKVLSLDTLQHSVSVLPSYNTSKGTAGLLLQYTYLEVHYAGYSSSLTVNPSYTFIISGNNIGQVGFRYISYDQYEDFFVKKFGAPLVPAEDMDSGNYALQAAYYYTFAGAKASGKKGLFSARAEGEANNARGSNWVYTGIKTSAGVMYPLRRRLRSNLLLEWYRQDFSHVNTIYDIKRLDDTYSLTASLTYTLMRHLDLTASYAHVRDASNIGAYDYSRNLYTMSLDYMFEGR